LVWKEILGYKILIGEVGSTEEALKRSTTMVVAGHSAVIANRMEELRGRPFIIRLISAAVYHNVSNPFYGCRWGQFGPGRGIGEISTA